ncbi:MAG: hypothetical protein ABI678_04235 [Kofleriaceae bacterium]
MKTLILLVAATSGCAWTTFDDLSDTTPARAEEKPDGVKSSDYGIAIVGATGTESTGGTLGVLSAGPGNFSTLKLNPTTQDLGNSESLGQHTIDSLSGNATLLYDGAGKIALVDNSNSSTVIVVTGDTNGLRVDTQIPTSAHPIATTYVNDKVVVATDAPSGMPNVFAVSGGNGVVSCRLVDSIGRPVGAAAVAIDGTKLWVYTKAGQFFGYALSALDTPVGCGGNDMNGTPVGAPLAPSTMIVSAGAAPNGGHIGIAAGKFAVLVAYDLPSTTTGAVQVVAISTDPVAVGTPVAASGVRSAAFDVLPSEGMLVLGYPNRQIGSTPSAGAVDLHTLALDTGVLSSPAEVLSIPGADSNSLFGRSVTTTKYNGNVIVAASASNVVYSYYQTTLYDKR